MSATPPPREPADRLTPHSLPLNTPEATASEDTSLEVRSESAESIARQVRIEYGKFIEKRDALRRQSGPLRRAFLKARLALLS